MSVYEKNSFPHTFSIEWYFRWHMTLNSEAIQRLAGSASFFILFNFLISIHIFIFRWIRPSVRRVRDRYIPEAAMVYPAVNHDEGVPSIVSGQAVNSLHYTAQSRVCSLCLVSLFLKSFVSRISIIRFIANLAILWNYNTLKIRLNHTVLSALFVSYLAWSFIYFIFSVKFE